MIAAGLCLAGCARLTGPGVGTTPVTETVEPAAPAAVQAVVSRPPATPEELNAALKASNPDYDGTGQFKMAGNSFVEADLGTGVADLALLQGMPLTQLSCKAGAVRDLTPLKGMPLARFNFGASRVVDLAPLKGMPLISFRCEKSLVADLAPLQGLPLMDLNCAESPVVDLAPLAGMGLTRLNCAWSQVRDLSPLKGIALTNLNCEGCPVVDLAPLKGMPLRELDCGMTSVSNLWPLKGMRLKTLSVVGTVLDNTNGEVVAGLPVAHLTISPELATDNFLFTLQVIPGLKSLNWHAPSQFFEIWSDLHRALDGKNVDLRKYAKPCNGGAYLFVPVFMTPDKAAEFCARHGGKLFSPSTEEELKAVNAMIRSNLVDAGKPLSVLTGAIWNQDKGTYRWDTGEAWDGNWWASQPLSLRSGAGSSSVLVTQPFTGVFTCDEASRSYVFIIEW